MRTSKLKEAYSSQNFALTKNFLIDVELELAELESEGLEEVPVTEFTFLNEIMAESKSTVENVNNAISFATELAGKSETTSYSASVS